MALECCQFAVCSFFIALHVLDLDCVDIVIPSFAIIIRWHQVIIDATICILKIFGEKLYKAENISVSDVN